MIKFQIPESFRNLEFAYLGFIILYLLLFLLSQIIWYTSRRKFIYLIIAAIGGAGSERIAMGILVTISQGGGTARWAFQNNGANMFLTDPDSNGNVYVRHTVGGTSTVSYSVLRIA
jgi:hypothetical protein